jgi:uncharacterized protein YndB with AHSA1/START domain
MDKPSFVYVTYITTTPEKLWNALRDSDMTRQYWGNRTNASDWKVGSSWQHRDADDASRVDMVGKVLEIDPPKRLVLSWAKPADEARPAGHSRVTFEIVPFGDAVRLTVTHEDFEAGSDMLRGISYGWPLVLSSLKSLLESGKPMSFSRIRDGWPPRT